MRLRRDSWIARAFFWYLRKRAVNYEGHRRLIRARDEGADLCTIIRTVFVVLPLYCLKQALCVSAGVAAVAVLILGPYVNGWRFGIAMNGLSVAIILVAMLAAHVQERRRYRYGSASALGAWVRAKKRHLCPLVEWRDADALAMEGGSAPDALPDGATDRTEG